MALTIGVEIAGQEATSEFTYCYMYEPLRVVVLESDLEATKLYIDLEIISTEDSTNIIETKIQYGKYDINIGETLSIDLMKMAQQYHDSSIYKFGSIDNIINGWESVVSKVKYKFKFYSDTDTSAITEICKLPIIGGRNFEEFTPLVSNTTKLTEFDILGIDISGRWGTYPIIQNSLSNPSLSNAAPTIERSTNIGGKNPCGGFVIWKSKFGGWCSWGFDIKTEDTTHKYEGELDVGMFESTEDINGEIFVPVNYTGISKSYSKKLKALSLSSSELEAVNGIKSCPVVYYVHNDTNKIELMKLGSATVPISNLSNGGDFSITLKSISTTMQKTI